MAKRIERVTRTRFPRFCGMADLACAGILSARGDPAGAAQRYASAAASLFAGGLGLYAAVARRRHGEVVGGATGQAIIAEADAWMTAHGVKNPPRMCDMYAPR